jgi:hypothetical protein
LKQSRALPAPKKFADCLFCFYVVLIFQESKMAEEKEGKGTAETLGGLVALAIGVFIWWRGGFEPSVPDCDDSTVVKNVTHLAGSNLSKLGFQVTSLDDIEEQSWNKVTKTRTCKAKLRTTLADDEEFSYSITRTGKGEYRLEIN